MNKNYGRREETDREYWSKESNSFIAVFDALFELKAMGPLSAVTFNQLLSHVTLSPSEIKDVLESLYHIGLLQRVTNETRPSVPRGKACHPQSERKFHQTKYCLNKKSHFNDFRDNQQNVVEVTIVNPNL